MTQDSQEPRKESPASSLAELFGTGGGFAQIFPDFEVRSEQIRMAEAVQDALAKSQHLLVEAGTGIGKSLAYLVPAAEWALAGKRKVVVSTFTKVLQNQLIRKDIPLLKQALGTDLRAEPVFGQENYVCRRRLRATVNYGLFDSPRQAEEIEAVIDWSSHSDGVLVNYPPGIDPRTAARIGRNSDTCHYNECPYREECHYFRARELWQQADLLVINHFLYFAHAATGYRLLPEFDAIIFDEAHRLEDVCARHYGLEVSSVGLDRLFNSIHHPRQRRGIITHLACTVGTRHHVDELLKTCRESAVGFFSAIRANLPGPANRRRVTRPGIVENTLAQPLTQLHGALQELANDTDDEDLAGEIQGLMKTCERFQLSIEAVLAANDPNSVYWIEAEPPDRVWLHSALIDTSRNFRTDVLEHHPTVILTSATLTVNREFRFTAERLGAELAKTLLLDSPFSFPDQAMLFLDDSLPQPNEPSFAQAASRRIEEILHLSQGRALVLFTSYDLLNRVFELIRPEKYRLLRQGDASTFDLLESFKQDVSSVLFATQSFWEGVDVPGEALSCLIITRLPFEVPDDPRLEGIAESLRGQGREPFTEYQLPQAVLRFRQGFGRLIRNKTDRGVVCVLDRRIISRHYGRVFVNSLPQGIKPVRNINLIPRFLAARPAESLDCPIP
jgi:ATP-dependent DNA helicase DinG